MNIKSKLILSTLLFASTTCASGADWSAQVFSGPSSFSIDGVTQNDSEFSQIAAGLELTHHYSDRFGIKLSYFDAKSDDFSLGLLPFNADKNRYKSSSMVLAATARTQGHWFVFGSLGANISRETFEIDTTGNSTNESSVNLYADFGGGFEFNNALSGTISYQTRKGKLADFDTIAFGVAYSF